MLAAGPPSACSRAPPDVGERRLEQRPVVRAELLCLPSSSWRLCTVCLRSLMVVPVIGLVGAQFSSAGARRRRRLPVRIGEQSVAARGESPMRCKRSFLAPVRGSGVARRPCRPRPTLRASSSRRSEATGSAAASTWRTTTARPRRGSRRRRRLGRRPRHLRDHELVLRVAVFHAEHGRRQHGLRRSAAWTSTTEYYHVGGTLLFAGRAVGRAVAVADDRRHALQRRRLRLRDQVLGQPRRRPAPAVLRQLRRDARPARLPDVRRLRHRPALLQRAEQRRAAC